MLTVTTPKRELPDTDMKKYAAVYALAMSYLDGRRGSDVQEGILIVSVMCVCSTIPRCNEKLSLQFWL